jgi:hypothetical protein
VSIRTHGSSRRRCATSSLRRVSSFSADEELEAGREPLLTRSRRMIGHRFSPSCFELTSVA